MERLAKHIPPLARRASRRTRWLTLASITAISPVAMAQDKPLTLDQQLQRQRTQLQNEERQARTQAPDVRQNQNAATDFRRTDLPAETPCFALKEIRLVGQRRNAFGFVQRYLDRYASRCVGHEGVGLIVRRAGDLLLDRGYVTTRVGLTEQDLSKGVLTITCLRPSDIIPLFRTN